jgi:hypothetical protein
MFLTLTGGRTGQHAKHKHSLLPMGRDPHSDCPSGQSHWLAVGWEIRIRKVGVGDRNENLACFRTTCWIVVAYRSGAITWDFRPYTRSCRCCQRDDTQNDTRHERLRRVSRWSAYWEHYGVYPGLTSPHQSRRDQFARRWLHKVLASPTRCEVDLK